jgi:hypothetical protein
MLDWMDPARIFEPEAEERARVSAAMRKRFLRLKAPLRSPVPPPFLSSRRIFLSFEATKIRTRRKSLHRPQRTSQGSRT